LKSIIALILFINSSIIFANYYDSSTIQEFKNGNLIDNNLVAIIKNASNKNFRPLGYKKSAKKFLFGKVHLERDEDGYFVYDVYCRKKVRNNVGPMKIPTNNIMNTEHTWPQSKGSRGEPMRGDLHHLFPTDSRANSARGNFIFGEVSGRDATSSCPASQAGFVYNPLTGLKTDMRGFEPPEEHRGNIARALFYFSSKYRMRISETEEIYLRRWHKEDPVDEEEIKRNDAIQKTPQGNRNPYIDFPNLVDRISNF
jgi:hypothetical protein